MTVTDASVVVDLLLGHPRTEAAEALAELVTAGMPLAAPELLDVEVAQVLRRYVVRADLPADAARAMLHDLAGLPIARYPLGGLVGRAFDWHANATVYDGVYLALAEALERPLLTGDARLSAVPGCGAEVTVVSTAH